MGKFIFNFIFLGLLFFDVPKDMTGKWHVEKVDASKAEAQLPAQQKAMMEKMMVKPFINSDFDFKPNHHFHMSAQIPGMPPADFWEYDSAGGRINISSAKDTKSLIMRMYVFDKDGDIYFAIDESNIILKVKRLE